VDSNSCHLEASPSGNFLDEQRGASDDGSSRASAGWGNGGGSLCWNYGLALFRTPSVRPVESLRPRGRRIGGGAAQVRAFEFGALELGALKLHLHEICADEFGLSKIRVGEGCSVESGVVERGAVEVCEGEVRTLEVDSG
jgi:hypothetical protein